MLLTCDGGFIGFGHDAETRNLVAQFLANEAGFSGGTEHYLEFHLEIIWDEVHLLIDGVTLKFVICANVFTNNLLKYIYYYKIVY